MILIIMNSNEHAFREKKIAFLFLESKQNNKHALLPSHVKWKVIDYPHFICGLCSMCIAHIHSHIQDDVVVLLMVQFSKFITNWYEASYAGSCPFCVYKKKLFNVKPNTKTEDELFVSLALNVSKQTQHFCRAIKSKYQ